MPPNLGGELVARHVWRQAVLGSVNVIAMVLAVRFTLLVAVCGAIFLTWWVSDGNPFRLIDVAIYCAAVVIPVTWLASRK